MLSNKSMPILAAVFGFLLAWFLKPVGSGAAAASAAAHADAGGKITRSANSIDPRSPSVPGKFDENTQTPDGNPLPPELISARAAIADNARNSLAIKDQGYVQRLAELLNLTLDQQQVYLGLFEQKRAALNIFAPGKGISRDKILEQAEAAETKFNDSLSKMLSAEQIDKLNAFRKQQAANRALAGAQKEYADVLEKIDITPEQQEAVLNALRDTVSGSAAKLVDKTGLFSETYDIMGLGELGNEMSDLAAANAAVLLAGNRSEIMNTLIENRKKVSAEKIERLRPHLTPAQLEQYNSILQARDESFFASMAPHLQAPVPAGLNEK